MKVTVIATDRSTGAGREAATDGCGQRAALAAADARRRVDTWASAGGTRRGGR